MERSQMRKGGYLLKEFSWWPGTKSWLAALTCIAMKAIKTISMFVAGICAVVLQSDAQISNNVTTSGFAYVFSSAAGTDPTLTLYRGVTYVFAISAIGHPFYVKTNVSAGATDAYNDGVVNNGTTSGLLTFAVPTNAPDQLSYNCAVHSTFFGMHGLLNILNPPTPPTGEIVWVSISPTGVTMKSLGTTNWTAIPEFSSNLVSGSWSIVPGYANVFAGGTNTTTFDRLDEICGGNVFLRVRNQFP